MKYALLIIGWVELFVGIAISESPMSIVGALCIVAAALYEIAGELYRFRKRL